MQYSEEYSWPPGHIWGSWGGKHVIYGAFETLGLTDMGAHGQKTYNFKCPWCYHFFDGIDARERKCASLVPSQDRYEWKFICMRSRSQECRRIHGGRSLYNFLAMYDHDLFTQYQLELKQENQQ